MEPCHDPNIDWASNPHDKETSPVEHREWKKAHYEHCNNYIPEDSRMPFEKAEAIRQGKHLNGKEIEPFFNPEEPYNKFWDDGPIFDSYNEEEYYWRANPEDMKEAKEKFDARQKEVDDVAESYRPELWDRDAGYDER